MLDRALSSGPGVEPHGHRPVAGIDSAAVLGDGAAWISRLADEGCPGAIQIVDLFHAKQHLSEVAAAIFGAGMHCTVAGADAILALRCCQLSGCLEDFWERRAAPTQAARVPHRSQS